MITPFCKISLRKFVPFVGNFMKKCGKLKRTRLGWQWLGDGRRHRFGRFVHFNLMGGELTGIGFLLVHRVKFRVGVSIVPTTRVSRCFQSRFADALRTNVDWPRCTRSYFEGCSATLYSNENYVLMRIVKSQVVCIIRTLLPNFVTFGPQAARQKTRYNTSKWRSESWTSP